MTLKPPISVWSPFPPIQSGISDYTEELLSELQQYYHIEVFTDTGYIPTPEIAAKYHVHHFTAFERRNRAVGNFAVNLHQLGNSRYHVYHYYQLLEYPHRNIVMIHDLPFGLTLFHHYAQMNSFRDFRLHISSFLSDDKMAAFDKAMNLWRKGNDGRCLDEWFMANFCLDRVFKNSVAQVVQTVPALNDLRTAYANTNLHLIPQAVKANTFNQADARRLLNIPEGTFIVGCFGHVARPKRLAEVLLGFKQFLSTHPDSVLLMVGPHDEKPYTMQLEEIAKSMPGAVVMTGHVEKEQFESLAAACDVIVGLRTDAPGQYSAGVLRAIAAAKPVLVSDLPQWGAYPASFTYKIPQDNQEIDTIANVLTRLADHPQERESARLAALDYYQDHSLTAMANRYHALIQEVIDNE